MTLASSGEISIGGSTANRSINLELGRSATATSNLNESALRTLAGVASGQISLSSFYGKSNTTVFSPISGIHNTSYTASGMLTGTTECRVYFNSNGTWTTSTGGSGNWGTGVSGSNYWIRYSRTGLTTSGSGSGGATGSSGWINLGSQVSFYSYATTSNNFQYMYTTATYSVEISTNSSGTNIVSSSSGFQLIAQRDGDF